MAIELSVSIDVPDLDAASAFYMGALGCTKVRDQGETMVVLSAGNADIYLIKRDVGTAAVSREQHGDIVRSYERHWTPVHLDFGVSDVAEAVAKLEAAGGVRESGEEGEWGAIAHCVDPFGNGFCVIRE